MARSRAAATGAPVPRAGSFQDALLTEVDYRERNLRLAEMTVVVRLATSMIGLLVEALPNPPERAQQLKRALIDENYALLGRYEAELFQERYLPEYQRAERERSRREKREAEALLRRDAAALARVAAFSNDAPTFGVEPAPDPPPTQ